ncbi:MAG: acetyl-CoA carboxylase biotin carboxyl carrier protein [Gemmatimonadota bacterium]
MIDFEFVQNLIQALDESSLDSLELERGGTRIRLSKSATPCAPSETSTSPGAAAHLAPVRNEMAPAAVPEAQEGQAETPDSGEGSYIEVTSPMVGTFYRAPAPDASPYVEVGARIGEGTVLCIIEAMKLMNELESDVEGTIAKILVGNAEPVEYGQVLFLIDPS